MKKIQKNFIIFFIIMFLFSFGISAFAGNEGSFINIDYDYLYNYNLIDYDELQNCNVDLFKNNYDTYKQKIIEVTQSDEVRSGNWIFFAGFYKSPFILLIKSDLITTTEPYFYICNWKEFGVQHFRLVFPDLPYKGSHPEEESSRFKMYYGETYFEAINGNMACTFVGSYSSTDEIFSIPYSSNFDNNVLIKFHDDSTKILRYSQPYIANTTEQLQNLNASMCAVLYDVPSSVSYLSLHKVDSNKELFNIKLSDFSDYVQRIDLENPFSNLGYVIPWDKTGFNYSIEKNQSYELRLTYTINNHEYNISKFYTSLVNFSTDGGGGGSDIPDNPTTPDYKENFDKLGTQIQDSNKETQNAIKEQTSAIDNQTEEIKKQHETSKNIFQKIGEMLSYINPFSENFFGRKLVELILNGLKSLFVPEEGFFSDYFNELRDWFSDRLGFLWAPFDFIIEVLNRIANINFSEPIIDIPDIKEPFTDKTLISATRFNFNTLLENETLKNVHDIYLFGVDFIICLGLYNLAKNKMEGVFKN